MKEISQDSDENVVVSMKDADDAGVYKISENKALVQTVDFITPIVDDPFTFGRIAACNSLSDVYAMGGEPLTALNIVCFPTDKFSLDKLADVLKGGLSVINEAGVQLLGGHTIDDEELKYGLSVTGIVDPERVIRNQGIKDGDILILTKPIGSGILATAVKAGLADEKDIKAFADSMGTLNGDAARLMMKYDIHACTDVTGFGLAGHLKEMLGNDKFEITIKSSSLPVFSGVLDHASMGMIPAGMYSNRDYIGDLAFIEKNVPQELADVIFDPQTSGGLLISLNKADGEKLLADLHNSGVSDAGIIGEVKEEVLKSRLIFSV